MKIFINLKQPNIAVVGVKQGSRYTAKESLTIGQEFDTLLIRVIDKLLEENRMDRLSLKTLEIQGNLKPGTVSSMILNTLISALGA